MVVVVAGLDALVVAIADAGALGLELGALVAHAGDDAQVVDVQGVHQVGGVDVFAHVEVVDPRLFLVEELAAVQATEQILDAIRRQAGAETVEAVVDLALAELVHAQLLVGEEVVEVLVGPDVGVIGLVATAELAAELDLGRVAGQLVVAGGVELDVLLGVLGVLFRPLHFVEGEVGRIVEVVTDVQARLLAVGETDIGEVVVAFEQRAADMPRGVLGGAAVADLAAEGPLADQVFAAEHVGLDLLGLLAILQLAPALGIARLAEQLGIGELDAGSVARLGVLEAAVQGAQVVAGEIVRAVVEVQTQAATLAADVVVALLELLEPGAIFEVPVAAAFDVVGTEVALLPAEGSGHAEVVDAVAEAEAVADGAGEFRAGLLGVVVVAALGAAGVEQALVVEGRQALHLDGATEGVGVHVRGQGLDHRQRLHQLGRQHIEGHGAAIRLRSRNHRAVDAHAVQIRTQATHADEAPLALVALHRNARQALRRLGGVLVGQLGHAVGMHGAFHAIRAALLLERLVHAGGLANHVDVLGGSFFGSPQRSGGNGQRQDADMEARTAGVELAFVHADLPR